MKNRTIGTNESNVRKTKPVCSRCMRVVYTEKCWNERICEQCDRLLKEAVM